MFRAAETKQSQQLGLEFSIFPLFFVVVVAVVLSPGVRDYFEWFVSSSVASSNIPKGGQPRRGSTVISEGSTFSCAIACDNKS